MRIAQAIETSGPGGAEMVLIRLCRELSAAGHDVTAVLLREGWLSAVLEERGVRTVSIPHRRPLDPGTVNALRRLAIEFRWDVLHSHEFAFAFYGRLATRGLACGHVATAHGANFGRGLKRRLAGAAAFRLRRRFRLVAVTRQLARDLESSFWLPRGSTTVVPNGIELPEKTLDRPRPERGPLRIVAVGNLYPVKNHGDAIRIIEALRRAGVDASLDILGRGGQEAALRRQIRESGLEEFVTLHGFRSDVGDFLGRAHVFLSTSHSEQMPLSHLEAMAHGLPVVCSAVGGVPEFVQEGNDGFLFPDGEIELAVARLRQLAADEPLRQAMGRRAREKVGSTFGVEAMVEQYSALYDSVLRERT